GALFLLVGVIYDRTHTREMANFGGLGVKMPVYAGMLSFCAFASLGLPGMTGFIAEISVLLSAFAANATVAAFSLIGLVVTAAYMLWMLQRVILGAVNPKLPELKDVCAREVLAVSPLMALTLFYGVLPSYVLSVFNGASVVIAGLFK
ncbi:MAG: NADH-quinone oxidoreductase subunit M, partial [Abditibacteriota bacterium]|nr:NADH-quinone oxidoreductase subunit M [Abditibacteriota bacterium]